MAGRLRLPSRPRDEARMTLIEHLEELRSRILRVGIAFVAVAILAGFFVDDIFRWLLWPSDLDQLNYLGPAQGLFTDIARAHLSGLDVRGPGGRRGGTRHYLHSRCYVLVAVPGRGCLRLLV